MADDTSEPVDCVVFDMGIYPRSEWSAKTVERYAESLKSGEVLPAIIIEVGTNRLLDGLHRLKAHQSIGVDVIEVERHVVPDGVPAKLYAASLSARHGDRMTGDDLKTVAREVLTSNAEYSMATVARLLGVHRETVGRWCGDISERRRQVRQVKALLLTRSGMSQRAAAEFLGVDETTVRRDVVSDIPPHFDELLADALDGLPDECRAIADTLQEELVFNTWTQEEQHLLNKHRLGETVSVNMHRHSDLIRWAEGAGVYVRIDRRSKWGNPFELPGDGDRDTVIANYDDHYLPNKPSLTSDFDSLKGMVLGCWCYPEACHGDVLASRADER